MRLALGALYFQAALAGAVEAPADGVLTAGVAYEARIASEQAHTYRAELAGDTLVVIEHIGGPEVVLEVRTPEGDLLTQTATWRGAEAGHRALISGQDSVTLTVWPTEWVVPAGDYRITLKSLPDTDADHPAETAMTRGLNAHLNYFFGVADELADARTSLDAAATAFAESGNKAREADALFESAVAYKDACLNADALSRFDQAWSLWDQLDDQTGLAAVETIRGDMYRERQLALNAATRELESAASRRGPSISAYFDAQIDNNLALVSVYRGEPVAASRLFERALEKWSDPIDLRGLDEAEFRLLATRPDAPSLLSSLIAMSNLGMSLEQGGQIEEAGAVLRQAKALAAHQRWDGIEASIDNNLAAAVLNTGDWEVALALYREALATFGDDSPDPVWESLVRNNLAGIYRSLGDFDSTLSELELALALRSEACDPLGRVETLREIAEVEFERGRVASALVRAAEALRVLEGGDGQIPVEAELKDLLARSHLRLGDADAALEMNNAAVSLWNANGRLSAQATALANRAITHARLGNRRSALSDLEEALWLAEQSGAGLSTFEVLTRHAQAALSLGESRMALDYAGRALDLSDDIRRQLRSPRLIRRFSDVQRAAYDVRVNAAIESGDNTLAWLEADRARARRFAELARRGVADVSDLSPESRARYDALTRSIAASHLQRTAFLEEGNNDDAGAVARELRELSSEREAVLDGASGASPSLWRADDVRSVRGNLGADDLVLEFYIGDSEGWLFAVSREDIEVLPLPPRQELEARVAELTWTVRRRGAFEPVLLRDLSQELLGGAGLVSDDKAHLIIIADGPIHLLSFAMLFDPASDYREPLLVRRELAYLPSMNALAQLRAAGRPAGSGIAVIADPVYQLNDPRLSSERSSETELQLASASAEPAPDRLRGNFRVERLPWSGAEADAICAAASGGRDDAGFVTDESERIDRCITAISGPVDGFLAVNASARRIVDGRLDRYRIIHFAAHGVFDAKVPEMSRLILSNVTASGIVDANNELRSHEIANLDLSAELVVLSGCDTALGEIVRGEGVVGMSRSFFFAGAERVISSLWQVQDAATAYLMEEFYRQLIVEQQPPGTALRLAQLHVREMPRWRDPYYWAAFVMQGDWENYGG